jgi:hypothetical protein
MRSFAQGTEPGRAGPIGAQPRNASVIREEHSDLRSGWPVECRGNMDVLIDALRASSVRAYAISSSYGLWGWVLAGACDRVTREKPATIGDQTTP